MKSVKKQWKYNKKQAKAITNIEKANKTKQKQSKVNRRIQTKLVYPNESGLHTHT